MNTLRNLRQKTITLNLEIFALYLSFRSTQVPWYARVLVALMLVYAVSPIDLIPDVMPVLGYLDDLIIFPAGAYFAYQLVPKPLLSRSRAEALEVHGHENLRIKQEVPVLAAAWILIATLLLFFIYKFTTPAVLWL